MANPTALLQSAVLMLHHINESATAERVQAGIEQVYREGKILTRDVGGTSGTKAFADAVLQAMEAPVTQA
jgi:isocitrate dehydrogenase (NAD+)